MSGTLPGASVERQAARIAAAVHPATANPPTSLNGVNNVKITLPTDLRVAESVTRSLLGEGKIDFSRIDKAVLAISSGYGRTAGVLGRRSKVLSGLLPNGL